MTTTTAATTTTTHGWLRSSQAHMSAVHEGPHENVGRTVDQPPVLAEDIESEMMPMAANGDDNGEAAIPQAQGDIIELSTRRD